MLFMVRPLLVVVLSRIYPNNPLRRLRALFSCLSRLGAGLGPVRHLGMAGIRQFLRYWFGEYTRLRKVVVGVLGLSIVLVGAAMLLLPGPAIIVIPAGLALLATEFAWARRLLRRIKRKFNNVYRGGPSKKS